MSDCWRTGEDERLVEHRVEVAIDFRFAVLSCSFAVAFGLKGDWACFNERCDGSAECLQPAAAQHLGPRRIYADQLTTSIVNTYSAITGREAAASSCGQAVSGPAVGLCEASSVTR